LAAEHKLTISHKIILAGDSAGGNLCLAVLSHLMHPHPSVPEMKLSEPFRGVLLISPWIAFDYVDPLPKEYRWDMLSGPALRETSAAFIGPAPADNYNEPVRAPPSWWEPLRQVTSSVYVYCGGSEMLRPSVEKISQAMSDSVNLTLNIVPGATHVSKCYPARTIRRLSHRGENC
jgi:acetyl esterase/lipase